MTDGFPAHYSMSFATSTTFGAILHLWLPTDGRSPFRSRAFFAFSGERPAAHGELFTGGNSRCPKPQRTIVRYRCTTTTSPVSINKRQRISPRPATAKGRRITPRLRPNTCDRRPITPTRRRSMLRRILIVMALLPLGAVAQTDAVDITAAFIRGGAVIEDLKVVQISDVVLILGKTNDVRKAERASHIATALGYQRVANLIVIRDDATDDAAIVYTGQRQLELEPALEGCRF